MMISRYGIFYKVIELGSFTKAAAMLGYSQSSVSQTIRALEKELGATLIARRKDGIRLTADGKEFFPYISSIYAAEKALAEKSNEMAGLEKSTIAIGTFTSISRTILPALIKQFQAQYPSVSFVLQQGEYTSIRQWVQEGVVDFGFVNRNAVPDMNMKVLYEDEMMAVLPENHALAAEKTLSLRELAGEPFILLDEGKYSLPLTGFSRLGITPDIKYKVYDDYTILAMIRQGLGVAMMYQRVLDGFEQGLAIRPIREPLKRVVALAWSDWETMPIAARRFASFVIARHADRPCRTRE